MREYISECRGCDPCIGCGRSHHNYLEVSCDHCHEYFDPSDVFIDLDGEELCISCLGAKHKEEILSELWDDDTENLIKE